MTATGRRVTRRNSASSPPIEISSSEARILTTGRAVGCATPEEPVDHLADPVPGIGREEVVAHRVERHVDVDGSPVDHRAGDLRDEPLGLVEPLVGSVEVRIAAPSRCARRPLSTRTLERPLPREVTESVVRDRRDGRRLGDRRSAVAGPDAAGGAGEQQVARPARGLRVGVERGFERVQEQLPGRHVRRHLAGPGSRPPPPRRTRGRPSPGSPAASARKRVAEAAMAARSGSGRGPGQRRSRPRTGGRARVRAERGARWSREGLRLRSPRPARSGAGGPSEGGRR